jgi:hypothetical protein
MFEIAKLWVTTRWTERTTWNGVILASLGAAILLKLAIVQYFAIGAIGYGLYQVWKEETK